VVPSKAQQAAAKRASFLEKVKLISGTPEGFDRRDIPVVRLRSTSRRSSNRSDDGSANNDQKALSPYACEYKVEMPKVMLRVNSIHDDLASATSSVADLNGAGTNRIPLKEGKGVT
jgi:hypothetical protein